MSGSNTDSEDLRITKARKMVVEASRDLGAGDRKAEPPKLVNRCADCGKFAPWTDLVLQIDYSMDISGNVSDDEYFVHKRGVECDS